MIAYHIPHLAIAEGATSQVFGGELRRFTLEEFADVDSDWAHGNYFVETTAVWTLDDSTKTAAHDQELIGMADLVRLAASAVLIAPLPSPRLSIRYYGIGEESRSRSIGVFDRTLLLSDQSVAVADTPALERVSRLAERWLAAGYTAEHPIFHALDAYGVIYTALDFYPELRMLPPLVALEGMIAPVPAPRIAERMAVALAVLLPGEGFAKLVRRLYGIRSDIIHGRPLENGASDVMEEVGRLVCLATIALLERLIGRGVDPQSWTDELGQLQP